MMRTVTMIAVCMLLPVLFGAPAGATSQSALADAWAGYSRDAATRSPAYSFPYQHCFDESARRHDMPVTLLLAVARGESDFNVTARSKADAIFRVEDVVQDTFFVYQQLLKSLPGKPPTSPQ